MLPMCGNKTSPARLLYRIRDDAPKISWPRIIFGETHQDKLLFCKVLVRHLELGVYSANLKESYLQNAGLNIYWDDNQELDKESLFRLMEKIETQFWRMDNIEPNAAPQTPFGESLTSSEKKVLRVGVLRSADLAYTNDIRNGFWERLRDLIAPHNMTLEIVDRSGPTRILPEAEANHVWEDKARMFGLVHKLTPFDYLVGVGTQACLAFRNVLGTDFLGHQLPFIFLGVTHPVESGLVSSMSNRVDRAQICGIGYGDGYRDIVSHVRLLFPDRAIKYVYQQGVPQDLEVARSLQSAPAFKDIEVIELKNVPTLRDLADERSVYLSWYCFERMFESCAHAETLLQRIVVATTRGNCRDGLAVAAVAADDREIGSLGAEMLCDHLFNQVDMGTLPVVIPRIYTWINSVQAKLRGIPFSQNAREMAREIFGDKSSTLKRVSQSTPNLLTNSCANLD
jgi:hypothetical protein